MKKLFSVIFGIFVIGFMLCGCSVSGSSSIVAIKFSKPVFYVDLNCATKLDYKVYPSTSKNYRVGYTTSQEGGFSLENGVVRYLLIKNLRYLKNFCVNSWCKEFSNIPKIIIQ